MMAYFNYASDYRDIEQLKHKIASIGSSDRHDIFKMFLNLDLLRLAISREELVCRRKNTITSRYEKLCVDYENAKALVDDMAMMALFRDL